MSGTVIDKATALKHSFAGSSINKIVCKASSHELAGPKKKHVDFLLALTNNPQADMVAISDMLAERLHNSNWVVVFKALITSHTLITLGNEKYLQALASKTNPFDLEAFTDRTSIQATEMTPYIHRYSRYLGAICSSYRAIVIDFFRMGRGDNSPFRGMDAAKLLKATGLIQNALDKLIDFEVTRGELNNGVINTSFTMLYQDLTKVYAAYNDAMINVLEQFFEMKKAQCKEAVECYRKFLTRQEGVTKFLSLAEDVGIDKKKHLNLRQVPEDLLPALEQHLEEMDAIRKAANVKQPSPQIQAASAKLSELKSKSPSNNTSGSNSPAPPQGFLPLPSGNEDILSAQRKRFDELKKRASDKTLQAVDESGFDKLTTAPVEDEFTAMATSRSTPQPQHKSGTTSGLDDLLGLDSQWGNSSIGGGGGPVNNPWGASTTPSANTNPFSSGGAVGGAMGGGSPNPWGTSGTAAGGYQEIGLFSSNVPSQSAGIGGGSATNGLGDILMPMSSGPLASQQTPPQAQKLTTDVDSSLQLAASNLSLELGGVTNAVNKGTGMGTGLGTQKKTSHQWGPESMQKSTLTGGPGYQGQRQIQPTTLPPSQMGGAGMGSTGGQPANWSTGGAMYGGGYFPGQQPNNPFGMQPQYPMSGMGGVGGGAYGFNNSSMSGSMFPPQPMGFPQQTAFPQQQTPFQSNNPTQPSLF